MVLFDDGGFFLLFLSRGLMYHCLGSVVLSPTSIGTGFAYVPKEKSWIGLQEMRLPTHNVFILSPLTSDSFLPG